MTRFLFIIILSISICNQSLSGQADSNIKDIVKVAVYDSPPFGFLNADSTFGGLSVEIWEDVAEDLGIQYEYFLTDMDELLAGLREAKYDIAIGAITITPDREQIIDFSHAVNPSGTGFAVSNNSSKSAFATYLKPNLFSLMRWLGILFLGIIFFGFVIWITEQYLNPNIDKQDRKISGLGESLWWAIVTMSTVGYGDKVPLSYAGKTIAIVWIFSSIILVALFTAEASSIFTVTQMELEISCEQDLRSSRVGAAMKSSGAEYCNH